MLKVGIVGCSGYTGIECIKLLLRHPEVLIVATTSRQADGGATVSDMHPMFQDRLELIVEDLSPEAIAERCEIAFCCLPHGASASVVSGIINAGCKAVDLSADYRLSSADLYSHWYGQPHADPGRLGQTPYGLPELFRESIRGAQSRSQSWMLSDERDIAPGSIDEGELDRNSRNRGGLQERGQRSGANRQTGNAVL
jgi:N-acetyl-gamma-glutamyl-phosphate reductase